MNSDSSENLDDFERDLAGFARSPLPDDWKAGMIDNALAKAAPEAKIVRFSLFQKISLTGIAACWLVIAALRLMTPAAAEPKDPAGMTQASPNTTPDLPLLVRYIEARNSLTAQF